MESVIDQAEETNDTATAPEAGPTSDNAADAENSAENGGGEAGGTAPEATTGPAEIRLEWKEIRDGATHEAISQVAGDETLLWRIDYLAAEQFSIMETKVMLRGEEPKAPAPIFPTLESAMAWCQERETLLLASSGPRTENESVIADAINRAMKPGSKEMTADIRDEHLREIEAAEVIVSQREMEWEDLKEQTKSAKESFDAAVEHLRKIIRHSGGLGPLFEQPCPEVAPLDAPPIEREKLKWEEQAPGEWYALNTADLKIEDEVAAFRIDHFEAGRESDPAYYETDWEDVLGVRTDTKFADLESAKEVCQRRDDELYAAAQSPKQSTDAPVDPDAWKSVKLAELTPKIGSRAIKALAEHNPPLTTHGELSAWQEKKADFWAKDVAAAKTAQDPEEWLGPSAGINLATLKHAAEIPTILAIDVAQRDSGQWAYSVKCSFGSKTLTKSWTGSFTSNAHAAIAGADAVDEFMPKSPAELPKAAKKQVLDMRAELDAMDKRIMAESGMSVEASFPTKPRKLPLTSRS